MAEIGLIASVLQVAGAGVKLSQTLYQYADGLASADRRIKDIAQEVRHTSVVIDELGTLFQRDDTSSLLSKNALHTANETVRECSTVFTELDTALAKSKKNTFGRLKFPFRESKIELLRSHIDKLKSTLQLLMQVLTHAHQVAAQKLDRESEAAQREQIKSLLLSKKESTKVYEESLRKYSMSEDSTVIEDDDSEVEADDDIGVRNLSVKEAPISSAITVKTLETCVDHIQGLLNDIRELQGALSDPEKYRDHSSERHRSLIGSYSQVRNHLDNLLFVGLDQPPSPGSTGTNSKRPPPVQNIFVPVKPYHQPPEKERERKKRSSTIQCRKTTLVSQRYERDSDFIPVAPNMPDTLHTDEGFMFSPVGPDLPEPLHADGGFMPAPVIISDENSESLSRPDAMIRIGQAPKISNEINRVSIIKKLLNTGLIQLRAQQGIDQAQLYGNRTYLKAILAIKKARSDLVAMSEYLSKLDKVSRLRMLAAFDFLPNTEIEQFDLETYIQKINNHGLEQKLLEGQPPSLEHFPPPKEINDAVFVNFLGLLQMKVYIDEEDRLGLGVGMTMSSWESEFMRRPSTAVGLTEDESEAKMCRLDITPRKAVQRARCRESSLISEGVDITPRKEVYRARDPSLISEEVDITSRKVVHSARDLSLLSEEADITPRKVVHRARDPLLISKEGYITLRKEVHRASDLEYTSSDTDISEGTPSNLVPLRHALPATLNTNEVNDSDEVIISEENSEGLSGLDGVPQRQDAPSDSTKLIVSAKRRLARRLAGPPPTRSFLRNEPNTTKERPRMNNVDPWELPNQQQHAQYYNPSTKIEPNTERTIPRRPRQYTALPPSSRKYATSPTHISSMMATASRTPTSLHISYDDYPSARPPSTITTSSIPRQPRQYTALPLSVKERRASMSRRGSISSSVHFSNGDTGTPSAPPPSARTSRTPTSVTASKGQKRRPHTTTTENDLLMDLLGEEHAEREVDDLLREWTTALG